MTINQSITPVVDKIMRQVNKLDISTYQPQAISITYYKQ